MISRADGSVGLVARIGQLLAEFVEFPVQLFLFHRVVECGFFCRGFVGGSLVRSGFLFGAELRQRRGGLLQLV